MFAVLSAKEKISCFFLNTLNLMSVIKELNVCVVVQFCFWFNLDFLLFFSMLIYDNEYQTKENPN